MATKIDIADMPTGVSYLSRDEWGLTDAEGKRRGLMVQPKGAVEGWWHHTAGSSPSLTEATWDDNPVAFIRHQDDMATSGALRETYRAVGYSFVIHKAPGKRVTIIEARGDYFPAATRGRNTISKAVCFAGNFDTRTGPRARSPRKIELDAARWLRFALERSGYVLPDSPYGPHSANPNCPGCTTCPGNLLLPHMDDLDVPYLVAAPPTPEPTPEPSDPTGALHDMYQFSYQKNGWPGAARFLVTARDIEWQTDGPSADVDVKAGVPHLAKGSRADMVALLRAPQRKHLGANPFNNGDAYDDPELAKLW